jgi:two-component system, NtrC family, sensor kinase
MTDSSTPRILLVDDMEQNRYIISRILQRAGMAVVECATGKEALERIQEQPELVILDVKLPDISGYEVCRRIKSNPTTGTIPVLQISAAFTSNESKVMALEGGADGFLTHPVDSTVLIATVRALLRLKRAETLMRESATQWQATFDALNEGLVLLDMEDRIIRCNRAFARLARLDFADIIGAEAAGMLPKCVGTAEFLQARRDARYTTEVQHQGRWFQITVDPVMSKERRFGSIVVLANIQERKLAEETLRNSEKLAATGRLAHTIAHEINNPLEALVNLIYLAQITALKPETRHYLEQALHELGRVSRISKQMLSFHRESSKPVEINAHELLDTVVALYTRQIENKNIILKFEQISTELMIEGFPGELRQVMANLVGNAVDASPPGTKIVLRLRPQTLDGIPGVSLSVCDSGAGIPRDIRKQIFEPFFTTKELNGSGVGLWLAKTIVNKHHGRLRFRTSTTPGRSGTCFSLFLPSTFAGAAVERTDNTVSV